jgi:cytochrome oxidase assembly protein ShyY1
MLVVAVVCVVAGTWQISRFEQKRHANDALRHNARAPVASVGDLLPLTTTRTHNPGESAVEFRRVRVTGTYDAAATTLVRNRTFGDDDTVAFMVVTPLDTAAGTLLVARGYIPAKSSATPAVAAPPSGRVTVVARLASAETRDDAAAQLQRPQVESVNPVEQAARLGRPVFRGYAELEANQPGTAHLVAFSSPDLSNPAGGALEPQHFAYIVQWYLFAALALAAPFAMARAERRERRPAEEFDAVPSPELTPEQARQAKLADRYGR